MLNAVIRQGLLYLCIYYVMVFTCKIFFFFFFFFAFFCGSEVLIFPLQIINLELVEGS